MRTFYLIRQEPGGIKTSLVDYNEGTGNWSESGVTPTGDTTLSLSVTISKKDYASNDTNVSIDETYNQLVLTCDLDELETLVESPTEEENLYSPYYNRQLYATEYASFGEGSDAFNGFKEMVTTGITQYDAAVICHHYVQLYKSNVWNLNGDQYMSSDHTGQLDFFKRMKNESCVAFLAEFGHSSPQKLTDQSIPKPPSMSKYLVITINGNQDNTDAGAYPTEAVIKSKKPLGTYVGNINGGFFSPTDDDTTNYLILSGKMIAVMAGQKNSGNFGWQTLKNLIQNANWMELLITLWHQTLHLDDDKNGDGAYYACKFYDAPTDKSDSVERNSDVESLYPFNSDWKSLQKLQYTYSAYGEEIDKISKFPLLQVTIKIGEKYACEMIDANGKSYYEWHTIDTCPYDTYQGEKVPRNYVNIGADIAIDDFIIGKEYDFANSVEPTWNIDASGIAIPIKKADGLSGKIEITIDGPVNSTFDQINRRHPSFWRHTKWSTDTYSVLANISHIMLKDFEVEIYSDNAQINNVKGDKDLIYQTEELTDYVEKKDDIEFKLSTALTTAECEEKGIKNSVYKNNPYIGEEPLRSITNTVTGFTGKPEEQYLNDYWPLYKEPKQILSTTVHLPAGSAWTSSFRVSGFNLDYYPMSFENKLRLDRTSVTLRQL